MSLKTPTQKTRVVAVNLSHFNLHWTQQVLLGVHVPSSVLKLSILQVSGSDATSFLQGQTTQDVKAFCEGVPFENCVLDGSGRLITAFAQVQRQGDWYLMVESKSSKILQERLENYVVSEDVEIKILDNSYSLFLGLLPRALAQEGDDCLPFQYLGIPGIISQAKSYALTFPTVEASDFLDFSLLQGKRPYVPGKELLPHTIYCDLALSLTKGCFLGQETVAKIVSRRGAAHRPATYKVSNASYVFAAGVQVDASHPIACGDDLFLPVTLSREQLQENKHLTPPLIAFSQDEAYHAILSLLTHKDVVDALTQDQRKSFVVEGLRFFLKLYPGMLDAWEMRGVLLTQLKRYDEAIACFEMLNKLDEQSVMACVNLSRIYGELGDKEKAEEYKAEGIVRSFATNAASLVKSEPSDHSQDLKTIKMLEEVLAIDPDDKYAKQQLEKLRSKNIEKPV